jgi:cytochrome oxidase Cu insertion factor (SCO1/SenC/PrrC family)
MKNQDKVVVAMTAAMLALAVPYLLVKTGVWGPAVSDASDTSGMLPMRDPDDLPVIGQLDEFSMTNQLGQTVRQADLLGQVWVADVIFTRCPGPCAMMTTRMADLQASVPRQWPVKFVSLTADAEYDTPEVLRSYAEEYQADSERWNFLHGTKPAIVDLAVNNLKLVLLDKEQERLSPNDLFIHSTTLALVDKHGRLRGSFESVPMVVSEDALLADGQLAVDQPVSADDWQSRLKPRLLKAIERLIAED